MPPCLQAADRCTYSGISTSDASTADRCGASVPAGDFKGRPKNLGSHEFGHGQVFGRRCSGVRREESKT